MNAFKKNWSFQMLHKSCLFAVPLLFFNIYVTCSKWGMLFSLTACGHEFQAVSGRFNSPNYPKPYPGKMNCEWVIRVPDGQRIEFKFLFFNVYGESDFMFPFHGLNHSDILRILWPFFKLIFHNIFQKCLSRNIKLWTWYVQIVINDTWYLQTRVFL